MSTTTIQAGAIAAMGSGSMSMKNIELNNSLLPFAIIGAIIIIGLLKTFYDKYILKRYEFSFEGIFFLKWLGSTVFLMFMFIIVYFVLILIFVIKEG